MTRKKGVALIICLTLIIGMALPGTLAFSGDPSATNENLTLAEDTPVPTPENSAEEKGCTCDPQPVEGAAHNADCPRYTTPEAPAEEENTCTCDPQPAEGQPHEEGCPFYNALSPVNEAAAAEEKTGSPVTESATGHIRIKINVFCVGDDGNASPQPGVPVEVRRDLRTPYYGDGEPLPDWSDGLPMFSGTSDESGVVNIKVPYTVVKDPDDNANDTAYLGDSRDKNHVILQRKADNLGYPIRFTIEPAQGSGYELNDVSEKIRNWKQGINAGEVQGEESDDFVFTSGIIDGDGQENVGAYVEFDLYVKKTASTEEPLEETVDINYVPVGPAGAEDFGSVTPTVETVKVMTGEAQGSAAVPGNGFVFVGWYTDPGCTIKVDGNWVFDNTICPGKIDGKNVPATYYAKFDYAVADLTIKQDGGIADENQTFIYVVTGGDLPESGIKVAVKGNSSVTIKNLKIGSYTVTEETNWNWRCGTTGNSQSITLQSAQTNEVSFTNNGSNFKWLSGNAYSVL